MGLTADDANPQIVIVYEAASPGGNLQLLRPDAPGGDFDLENLGIPLLPLGRRPVGYAGNEASDEGRVDRPEMGKPGEND